jgi:prepilin-type N-terminal cleavage/methylation domain-containing protein
VSSVEFRVPTLHAPRSTLHVPPSTSPAAFTLIELLIVVAIMGIVLTMGVPIFYRMRAESPLRKAVKDVVEVCSHARALAILQSKATCVVFHPREGNFAVQGGGTPSPSSDANGAPVQFHAPSASPGSGLSGQLSDRVVIEMLDVDLTEYKDNDEVKVWFYPNGVCDELTLILFDPSVGHDPRRVISLEVTTGLASVELDPRTLITSRR